MEIVEWHLEPEGIVDGHLFRFDLSGDTMYSAVNQVVMTLVYDLVNGSCGVYSYIGRDIDGAHIVGLDDIVAQVKALLMLSVGKSHGHGVARCVHDVCAGKYCGIGKIGGGDVEKQRHHA